MSRTYFYVGIFNPRLSNTLKKSRFLSAFSRCADTRRDLVSTSLESEHLHSAQSAETQHNRGSARAVPALAVLAGDGDGGLRGGPVWGAGLCRLSPASPPLAWEEKPSGNIREMSRNPGLSVGRSAAASADLRLSTRLHSSGLQNVE